MSVNFQSGVFALLGWLFGVHVFEVAFLALVGFGITLAVAPTPSDIARAHWLFGAAFVILAGRIVHLLIAFQGPIIAKPLVAAALLGSTAAVWMGIYQWVDAKLPAAALPAAARIEPTAAELAAELAKRLPAPARIGRQLSEWQRVMLTSVLSQHAGTKILILVSLGEETLAYANDFREVFLAANWKPEGPKPAPPQLVVMDVRIAADNAGVPRPVLTSLMSALKTAQIKSAQRYVLDEHIARDSMVLWVGSQSPEGWGPETIAPIGVPKEYWTRPDGPPEPGDISRPGVPPVVTPRLSAPPTQRSAHYPRLVVEQVRVNTPVKVFGGFPGQIVAKAVSYANLIVKNDPLSASPDGVAKSVTAHSVFSNGITGDHLMTTQAVWDKEKEMQPSPAVVDHFAGGGPSVWFNVGQRRNLILAFKIVDEENAYAQTVQPNVDEIEVAAPGLALPPGQYRIVLEVRSAVSNIREDFVFTMSNPGKGAPLTLTPASRVP